MAYNIKKLEVNDWQALRDIRLRALQSDPAVFGSNYAKEAKMTEADWQGWLQSADTAIFMIFDEHKPIAMTGIALDKHDPSRKTAKLWGSWIDAAYRKQGLSKLLYAARLEWAIAQPEVEKIIVSHRASNSSSRQANQKHGFAYTHTVPETWPDGTREDEVFYALDVPQLRWPQASISAAPGYKP
jgi:RimJ/RimL family protein N-acetyltransferase